MGPMDIGSFYSRTTTTSCHNLHDKPLSTIQVYFNAERFWGMKFTYRDGTSTEFGHAEKHKQRNNSIELAEGEEFIGARGGLHSDYNSMVMLKLKIAKLELGN